MNKAKFQRSRINPIEYLSDKGINCPWLQFDPSINKGSTPMALRRVSQSRHDGTHIFTHQAFASILEPLANRQCFHTQSPPENHPGKTPIYTLGWMRLAVTYPPPGVELPAGKYPGQRERVSLAYVVDWV